MNKINIIDKSKEENKIINLSLEERINSLFSLYTLQIKTLFKTPLMIFITFAFPIILLFGLGILLSEATLFVSGFGLQIILITGIIFGYLYYSSTNTTFHKNHILTKTSSSTLLLSILMVILTFSFLSTSFEFIVMIVFTKMNWVFSESFSFVPPEHPVSSSMLINWSTVPFGQVFYYWLMTLLISYVFFSLFRIIFKSNQTFSMFVLSFFLYTICFGGVTIPTFNLIQSDGQLWSKSFSETKRPTIQYNKWSDYASLLTPESFLNQTFFTILYVGAIPTQPVSSMNGFDALFETHSNALPAGFTFFKWSDDPSYNLALILPFAYLLGMSFISFGVIKEIKFSR